MTWTCINQTWIKCAKSNVNLEQVKLWKDSLLIMLSDLDRNRDENNVSKPLKLDFHEFEGYFSYAIAVVNTLLSNKRKKKKKQAKALMLTAKSKDWCLVLTTPNARKPSFAQNSIHYQTELVHTLGPISANQAPYNPLISLACSSRILVKSLPEVKQKNPDIQQTFLQVRDEINLKNPRSEDLQIESIAVVLTAAKFMLKALEVPWFTLSSRDCTPEADWSKAWHQIVHLGQD